jgi:hypothetical protein
MGKKKLKNRKEMTKYTAPPNMRILADLGLEAIWAIGYIRAVDM